jgi:hypothetical protein
MTNQKRNILLYALYASDPIQINWYTAKFSAIFFHFYLLALLVLLFYITFVCMIVLLYYLNIHKATVLSFLFK